MFTEKWNPPGNSALKAIEQASGAGHDSYDLEIVILSSAPRNDITPDFLLWMESCPFTLFVDHNGDAKRAMSVNNVPHLFLTNKEGHIIWNLNSWNLGDEEKIANALEAMEH